MMISKSQFEELIHNNWSSKIPGAAVAKIEKDSIDVICLGVCDKKNKNEVNQNSVFQAGSLSKTLTAWAVMKLHESEMLDISAPISDFIPEDILSHIPKKEITISQLLSHTSGLKKKYFMGKSRYDYKDAAAGLLSKENIYKMAARPGGNYLYTGLGYNLIQYIIEKVTNVSFAAFMEREILLPLGMKNSFFEPGRLDQFQMAKPYGMWGRPIKLYYYNQMAAAGLYTTLSDFSIFIKGNLDLLSNKDSIISRKLFLKMICEFQNKVPYGLGYKIDRHKRYTILSHSGMNRGYCSRFMFFKRKPCGIVILTNSTFGQAFCNNVSDGFAKYIV